MKTKIDSTRLETGVHAEITLHKQPGIDYKKDLSQQTGKAHARSSMKIIVAKGQIRIAIKASDSTALRAAINSVMRDAQVLASVGTANLENRRAKLQRTNTPKTDDKAILPQNVKVYKNIE